jgi:hypothetical protein
MAGPFALSVGRERILRHGDVCGLVVGGEDLEAELDSDQGRGWHDPPVGIVDELVEWRGVHLAGTHVVVDRDERDVSCTAAVRCGVGGGDGRSGAFGRRRYGERWARQRARQIVSECLIMPDTCPGQPAARRLACLGCGSSVP